MLSIRFRAHRPSVYPCLAVAAIISCLTLVDRPAAADESFIGVVTADIVYVRSGPADSYYPFGRARRGDLVKVTGERFNWARVRTVGPMFEREEFFGYIIYPKTQPGRFRVEEDGKRGVTLGRMDVLAPNLNTNFNPNDSWKPLIRLDADRQVTIRETLESGNNTVQKIALPDDAEAWISMTYVRRANEQELLAWKRATDPEFARSEREARERAARTEAERREREAQRSEAARGAERTPAEETPERVATAPDDAAPEEMLHEPERESKPEHAPERVLAREESPPPPVREPSSREVSEHEEPAQRKPREALMASPEKPVAIEPEDETVAVDREADAPTTGDQLAEASLDDLEAVLEQLRREPIETAEVAPALRMYERLAARADDETTARFASARAEQLRLWLEIQERRQEIAKLRSRARLTEERAEAAQLAVDAAGEYTAVGRLSVSTIYDGHRLPRLLRLQDPGSGRTVAYVEPDDGFDLTGMIGQLIGVIGTKEYDGGLRLNLIQPRRIDILAPQR